ncbi:MAG: IclR family transcriptional regulator [Desulfosarcinaceae bacterium]|nr:IclR family transcriptional regulator [Desulfosarcinaceae bacterium]
MKKPKKAAKTDPKKKNTVPIVDSLATALSLLDHFTLRDPELSLTQLSEKTGLYKSRIHRLCGTLVYSGFLIRMPWASYRLGPKLMTLGKIYENTNTLATTARPIMRELANNTGESVALFSLSDDTALCLAREFGSSQLVFSIQEGDRMHLHASAVGRVLLAYGTEELRERVLSVGQLESFTPMTMVDPDKIRAALTNIKARGYAINRGETELEVAAVAAPLFNHDGRVEAAMAVVGPVQRFSEDRFDDILDSLLAATGRISKLLGAAL